jgi:hypothetical protein
VKIKLDFSHATVDIINDFLQSLPIDIVEKYNQLPQKRKDILRTSLVVLCAIFASFNHPLVPYELKNNKL